MDDASYTPVVAAGLVKRSSDMAAAIGGGLVALQLAE
jgi:glycerol-3-phosphate responsive antiterminator